MVEFFAAWGWPQWITFILIFLGMLVHTAKHGEPRIYEIGAKKGQPQEYNATLGILRAVFWFFLLAAGGFFGV